MSLSEQIKKRILQDITLKQLMDHSDRAVFCRDFSGTIVYWGKNAEELYGYMSKEMEGSSISLIKPANYPVELPFIDDRVKQGELIKDFETTRIDKEKRILSVLSSIIPLEVNGKCVAAIHLEKNITKEKNKSHEKRFRKILESFPDVIFELDKDFKIIWANKIALEIQPLAIGMKCYEAYADSKTPCDGCAIVQALENGTPQQSLTHHLQFHDEEKYWENLAIPVKDSYGNITSIIEVSRDITTKKMAEMELFRTKERLELSMKAGNVAWWIWDYQTGFVEYDKRKAEMAGYSYEEFPKNVYKITELIHPDDYDKTMKVMMDHLKGHTPEYRIDYRLKTKNNDYVWFHDRGKVIERQEDGTPLKLSGAVIDITKRKEVEEKLRTALDGQKKVDESLKTAKNQAEEANKAKSEFLANMSHEIRTPLNGIVGFTELLLKTDLTQAQKRYMDHVHNSATALMDIINDILDFSKIEAGKLELNYEQTDLGELIKNSLDVIKYKVREKDIRLTKDIDKRIPLYLLTDPIRLRQILTNLLSNAAKFTEHGQISLSVHCIRCLHEDSIVQLHFAVKDTGIGISAENQKKVFNSFLQADHSTTKKYGGTGLGLSITNSLLQMMGSSLNVESKLEEGSTFSFDLELKAVEPDTITLTENQDISENVYYKSEFSEKIEEADIKAFKTQPVKILIAEDNEVNMELTEIILKDIFGMLDKKEDNKSPLRIIKAVNGKEAIEQYLKESPEIVFLDIQMPVKNGYQVAKNIRKHESETLKPFVVALTAAAVKGEREKCLQAGMDEYITKPVVNQSIKEILQRYLEINNLKVIIKQPKKPEAITKDTNHSINDQNKIEHFNSQQLKKVFNEDQEMFNHILSIGKNSLIEEAGKLRDYLSKGQISGLKKSAHKVKGMALNLRFERLQQLAEKLEKSTLQETSVEIFQPLTRTVIEEINFLTNMLEDKFNLL